MSRHWSGVEMGHYFELTIEFDPEIYSESSVVVPLLPQRAIRVVNMHDGRGGVRGKVHPRRLGVSH